MWRATSGAFAPPPRCAVKDLGPYASAAAICSSVSSTLE
jgi:hypothetical protein